MTEPPRPPRRDQPLGLGEVYDIVERRRRRRTRNRAVVAPATAVGAVGLAGLLVVAIQAGGTPGAAPAAPPGGPSAALATAPTPPTSLSPPVPTVAPAPTAPATTAPPFDPAWLDADYLPSLADSVFGRPAAEQDRLLGEATVLAHAWGVSLYPTAKAVVAKADGLGTPLNATDPHGADKLISRFEGAGYTEEYAAELARAWNTDPRSAEIVGALVIEVR
jgi:hypothetical protein